jgi:hypothetical protein
MADLSLHMPEVDVRQDIARYFARARELVSAHEPGDHPDQRYVVLITPGRLLLPLACPKPGSIAPEMVQSVARLAPAVPPRQISVIAFTELFPAQVAQGPGSVANVARLIPFLGYILGLGYIGHTVTIFEGHPSALRAGCQDVDLLVVDKAMVPCLQKDWASVALGVMRGPAPAILVFGRDGSLSRINKKSAPTD